MTTNEPDDLDRLEQYLPPEEAWDTDSAWQRLSARISQQPQGKLPWRGPTLAAAALVILALGVTAVWRNEHASRTPQVAQQQYRTLSGERRTVTLADGTVIELAPMSLLRVGPRYGHGQRDVDLEGEAFFTVVHNPAQPFTVHARNAETRVLGTTFDVKAYASDAAVEVVVATGRVSLKPAHARDGVTLSPGQAGLLGAEGPITVRTVDIAAQTAWRRGRLAFRDARFADVAKTVQQWYGVDIRINSTALADAHVTAQFAGQSVDEVLDLLAATLNARLVRDGTRATFEAK